MRTFLFVLFFLLSALSLNAQKIDFPTQATQAVGTPLAWYVLDAQGAVWKWEDGKNTKPYSFYSANDFLPDALYVQGWQVFLFSEARQEVRVLDRQGRVLQSYTLAQAGWQGGLATHVAWAATGELWAWDGQRLAQLDPQFAREMLSAFPTLEEIIQFQVFENKLFFQSERALTALNLQGKALQEWPLQGGLFSLAQAGFWECAADSCAFTPFYAEAEKTRHKIKPPPTASGFCVQSTKNWLWWGEDWLWRKE